MTRAIRAGRGLWLTAGSCLLGGCLMAPLTQAPSASTSAPPVVASAPPDSLTAPPAATAAPGGTAATAIGVRTGRPPDVPDQARPMPARTSAETTAAPIAGRTAAGEVAVPDAGTLAWEIRTAGRRSELWVTNGCHGEVTLSLELALTHAQAEPFERNAVLPAVADGGGPTRLAGWTATRDDAAVEPRIQARIGDAGARHEPERAYALPWAGPRARYLPTAEVSGRFEEVELGVALGTPVLAARAGRVVAIRAYEPDGWPARADGGRYRGVWLRHADRTLGYYRPLAADTLRVALGQEVPLGGWIGTPADRSVERGDPSFRFGVRGLGDGLRAVSHAFRWRIGLDEEAEPPQRAGVYAAWEHPIPADAGAALAAAAVSDEAAVLALCNAARAEAGVPALAASPELDRVAAAHSRDMVARGFFSHTNPDGLDPGARLRQAGLAAGWIGENIAFGSATPEGTVDQWLKSPGHRANILSASYARLGVGLAFRQGGEVYWTQVFSR